MSKKLSVTEKTLVVTNGDRVLCVMCFDENFDPQDDFTSFYKMIYTGICEDCGFSPEKEGDEWQD